MTSHLTAQPINCVCHSIKSMFRVLCIYNFAYNTKNYEMSFMRLELKFPNNFTPSCYVKVKALLSLTLSLVMSPCISVCVAKNGAWCALKKIQLWSLV